MAFPGAASFFRWNRDFAPGVSQRSRFDVRQRFCEMTEVDLALPEEFQSLFRLRPFCSTGSFPLPMVRQHR